MPEEDDDDFYEDQLSDQEIELIEELESLPPPSKSPEPETKKESEVPQKRKRRIQKVAKNSNVLRITLTSGNAYIVISPIDAQTYVSELVKSITANQAKPDWTGWYNFQKTDGKTVYVNVRHIDSVEQV